MNKIINIHRGSSSGNKNMKPRNLAEPLINLSRFHQSASELLANYAPFVDQGVREVASLAGLDAEEFSMIFSEVEYFDSMLKNGFIGDLHYYANINEAEYRIKIVPPEDDDPEYRLGYEIRKYESGIFYSYNFRTRSWEDERSWNLTENLQKIWDSDSPEADILDEIAKVYNGELTEKKYRSIKSKNKGLFHLYEQVRGFMAPYYQLNANSKKGKLYLIPDDIFQLGFQVGWNGSEYVLYQILDPVDLAQMEDDFWEEGEVIPDNYIREVGRTSDVKKMYSCLWTLTDRPVKDITATVPLSLEVFTETACLSDFGHKLLFINCPKRKLSESEQNALDSAREYIQSVR